METWWDDSHNWSAANSSEGTDKEGEVME